MSTKGAFKVECPSCHAPFTADFWTVVRGDQDRELKELLLSGEFDLLMCPDCACVFSHEETFIYLDPEKELFVFVLPETYLKEKEKWLAKMRADYDSLKGSIVNERNLRFEPLFFFGAGDLSALLMRDRDIEEETEVMEFIAAEKKFSTAAIAPSFARAHDLPFSLPYFGASPSREEALAAAKEITELNDALARVGNLRKLLEALPDTELGFILPGKMDGPLA